MVGSLLARFEGTEVFRYGVEADTVSGGQLPAVTRSLVFPRSCHRPAPSNCLDLILRKREYSADPSSVAIDERDYDDGLQ